MTEETKQVDKQTEQATETEDTGSKKDWEKIAKDAQRRADEAKAKLKAREQAEIDAAKQAETARLEAAGEYKTLLAKQAAEHQAQLDKLQRDILRRDLRDQLRQQAVSGDEVFLDYAADRFAGTAEEIATYIDALKNEPKTSKYFQESVTEPRPGNPAPAAASVKGAHSIKLEDRLKSSDPQVKLAALKEQFAMAVK